MPRILILEPQPEVRDLLGIVAARLGLEASSVTDPEPPDLVLLEPASELGLERVEDIHRRFPAVPIVCVSVLPPMRSVRIRLEPVAYLMKPFAVKELERTLVRALEAVRS